MTDERDPMRELFGEVIHTYTRAQALADGSLIDVTETAAEAGFRLPVAVTRTVWLRYCEWPEELGTGQSTEGRLWDVLWLAVWAARTAAEPSARITYTLGVVPVDDPEGDPVDVRLWAAITGEGAGGAPAHPRTGDRFSRRSAAPSGARRRPSAAGRPASARSRTSG